MHSRIGPYTVTRELGRGGMGVVYLAHDMRLDRDVAIKALPPHVANDPDRLARFQREAKVLASLNHPAIGAIYGIEEVNGQQFLVLEYIRGETLDARLERGALPIDEAVELAVGIAEALEAAHEKGVTHRDLKPGNIMVTPEGAVKVLDFGLARTSEATSSMVDSPAMIDTDAPTMPVNSPTIPGAIMGTAGYMSPEQARGKPVDKRSDIFSFGCVLYEMLTGVQPFRGETVADCIGATLHKEYDQSLLPPGTPNAVHRVLHRCLMKDKRERLRDIGDARLELQSPAAEAPSPMPTPTLSAGRTRVYLFAGGVNVLVLAGIAVWMMLQSPSPIVPEGETAAAEANVLLDAELRLAENDRLAHGFSCGVAISPDGRSIAFTVAAAPSFEENDPSPTWDPSRGIMIRHLDQPMPIPLAGPGERSGQPVFSPDGKWVAYVTGEQRNEIYKVPVSGGQPTKISTAASFITGLAWGEDDNIIVGQLFGSGLWSLPASGGAATRLTEVDRSADVDEDAHAMPHILPGGRGVLHVGYSQSMGGDRQINAWVWDAATNERKLLIRNAAQPQYVNGHILFVREGALMVAPFDLDSLSVTGSERLVGASVMQARHFGNVTLMTGAAQFAVSPNGTLVMAEGSVPSESPFSLTWVDREGNETPLDIEQRFYLVCRLMPDGKRIFLSSAYAPTRAIWMHELQRGISRRVARTSRIWAIPGPGPDEVTGFFRDDAGQVQLGIMPIDSVGMSFEPIALPEEDDDIIPAEWSRDGRYLVAFGTAARSPDGAGEPVLWMYERDGAWSVLQRGTSSDPAIWPTISPDGRWLAYSARDTGNWQVFVRPLLEDGPTQQVSVGTGSMPAWSADGSELIYMTYVDNQTGPRDCMAVTVTEASGRLQLSRPVKLFTEPSPSGYVHGAPVRAWDIAPDGRFIFLKTSPLEQQHEFFNSLYPDRLRIIYNWASTLGR